VRNIRITVIQKNRNLQIDPLDDDAVRQIRDVKTRIMTSNDPLKKSQLKDAFQRASKRPSADKREPLIVLSRISLDSLTFHVTDELGQPLAFSLEIGPFLGDTEHPGPPPNVDRTQIPEAFDGFQKGVPVQITDGLVNAGIPSLAAASFADWRWHKYTLIVTSTESALDPCIFVET